MPSAESPVLLFDGVCHLCDRSVQFLLRHDKHALLRFAPLQSEVAKKLLSESGFEGELPDGVVLADRGKLYFESDAALRALGILGGFWKIPAALRFVPRFIRQFIYRLIARNRYRWFGKYETCQMPRPELKGRFLDQISN